MVPRAPVAPSYLTAAVTRLITSASLVAFSFLAIATRRREPPAAADRTIRRSMASLGRLLDSRAAPALGLAATAAIGLFIALHGVSAAWWTHADPDGAYAGSGLNILRGNRTTYLDHPGLPTQVGLAVAFGGDFLVQKARGRVDSRAEYVDARLLDLDAARPIYRTWAILQYVGGALLVFATIGRFFRHWTWGFAAAVLFLAAPGLAEISTLLRPDAAVAALCLAVGVVTAAAFESRSALRYVAAAALLGFAITYKLPALGLVVPLALAAALRPPRPGWWPDLWRAAKETTRRHRRWLVPAAAVWLALSVVFNRERLPIVTTDDQRDVLTSGATLLVGYLGFAFAAQRLRIPWANRVFVPFYGLVLLAFVAGLAVPATFVLDAGAQVPVSILDTLTGGGVNQGIEPFSEFRLDHFQDFEQRGVFIVGGLALLAAVVGALRRRWWPLLLCLGAAVLATMAAARIGWDYYFAPAFAVAIPPALRALRRRHDRVVPLHAWIVVLVVFVPLLSRLPEQPRYQEAVNADAQRLADQLLEPGEAILTPPAWQLGLEDTWYAYLVEGFVEYVPEYPYRFVWTGRIEHTRARGGTPRYFVSSLAEIGGIEGTQSVELGGDGPFTVRRVPIVWGPDDAYGVLEILRAP
jgi:hypothetical protein